MRIIPDPGNRWTRPHLDADKESIECDLQLKTAVAALKAKFVTSTEALIHADLHTGAVTLPLRMHPLLCPRWFLRAARNLTLTLCHSCCI